MSSLEVEIADIERELLALSGNQTPNPAQIATFKVTRTTVATDEVKTIAFGDGVARFVQVYGISGAAEPYVYYVGGDLKVMAEGAPGVVYSVVSLGAFSLV